MGTQSEQQLTTKIASICPYDALLRIWNVIYTNFSLWWKIYFLSLSVSQNFKIPKMSLEKRKFGKKSQILPKSWKINKCWFLWQILRQFCSLDPKVLAYKFYYCGTLFPRIFSFLINFKFFWTIFAYSNLIHAVFMRDLVTNSYLLQFGRYHKNYGELFSLKKHLNDRFLTNKL